MESGFENYFIFHVHIILALKNSYEYFENNDHRTKLLADKIDYSLVIYGKPNAGKSTFLANSSVRILKEY